VVCLQHGLASDPCEVEDGSLHTGVPLAAGVVHPPACRLAAAQRHRWQLLEIVAELLDVAVGGNNTSSINIIIFSTVVDMMGNIYHTILNNTTML